MILDIFTLVIVLVMVLGHTQHDSAVVHVLKRARAKMERVAFNLLAVSLTCTFINFQRTIVENWIIGLKCSS